MTKHKGWRKCAGRCGLTKQENTTNFYRRSNREGFDNECKPCRREKNWAQKQAREERTSAANYEMIRLSVEWLKRPMGGQS